MSRFNPSVNTKALDDKIGDLSTKKADKTDLQNISKGSPKGVYATLSALQTAFPAGDSNIYLVTADGKWYYWNGTAWTAGGIYQGVGISNDSVTSKMLNSKALKEKLFDEQSKPANYFNKNSTNIILDKYASVNSGTGIGDSTTYRISHKIYASQGDVFTLSSVPWGSALDNTKVVFYNNSDAPIGSANSTTFTVPANTSYFRFTIANTFANSTSIDTFMVVKGSQTPSEYTPYGVNLDLIEWFGGLDFKQVKNVSLASDMIQIGAIQNKLYEEQTQKGQTINYFNKNSSGLILDTYVFINSTNGLSSSTDYTASHKVYTKPNEQWVLSESPWGSAADTTKIVFYDATDKPIASAATTSFTVPNNKNISYFRFSIHDSFTNMAGLMLTKGTQSPTEYVPFGVYPEWLRVPNTKAKSKIEELKWVAGGDSITAWNPTANYVALINTSHGVNGLNYGLGGRAIASRGSTTDTTYKPMVTAYLDFPSDADIITIFCGTNDYGSQVALGTIDSTLNTEFYGALNILANGLIDKYPGKKIALITPMQRRDSENTIPLKSYVQAVKDIGFKYGIPVFDMFNNCGLYPKNDKINTTYFTNSSGTADGLHPNPEGHKVFAPRIAAFLETL
ncbi:SGNH/GDSL hydrolase family protein [Priestia megaterium]|uniref:SGNH/GDSL hydrolase family protein n=1 Tax=Priestia megaterium TaxID=1404 RepID=UPI00300A37AE